LASKILKLPAGLDSVINVLQLAVITFFSARIIILLLGYSLKMYLTKKQEDPALARSLDGMLNVVKFLIWSLALIIFLDNIGFKVTTMIAGLGIGGLAVAIAAQAVLADILAAFSIYFDKPFRTGDFIVVGNDKGFVKYIGIKTTRIQTPGELSPAQYDALGTVLGFTFEGSGTFEFAFAADGSFTYTPNPNFNGSDNFTWAPAPVYADSLTNGVSRYNSVFKTSGTDDFPGVVQDPFSERSAVRYMLILSRGRVKGMAEATSDGV